MDRDSSGAMMSNSAGPGSYSSGPMSEREE
jgi:hypothetical protein